MALIRRTMKEENFYNYRLCVRCHGTSVSDRKNMSSRGGQFNYALKKTGFLGEAKMRAKRISKNPKQFLENYAERDLEIVPLECSALEGFIDNLNNVTHYDQKETDMLKKQALVKKRTFLLNLASSSSIATGQLEDDLGILRESEESHNAEIVDDLIDNFLATIKKTDLTAIETWLSLETTMNDLDLPYGLPIELKLPKDPDNIKDAQNMNESLIDFIESANDDFLLLDGEYHTKLEEVTKELRSNFVLISQENWPLEDTALLSYIFSTIGESGSLSTSTAVLNELTSRLFPNKSREEVIAQKYRLRTKRCLEEKQASIVRDWIRDKEDLQKKVNQAWQEMNKKFLQKLEQVLNRRRQDMICNRWIDQLDKLRKAKCEKIRRLQILVEPVEEQRAEKAKLQEENEACRRAMIKLKVKGLEEKRAMEKFKEIRRKEFVANMLKEIEKMKAKKNRSRVDFRLGQTEARNKAKKEAQISLEQERQLRKEVLESTKEPVEIDYDPCNLIADTHASAVRRYITLRNPNSEEDAMVKFFRERYSFSTETILKDRRNRVEAKLREAGLLDSSYARQVLLAMEPKPKPHLDCQIKFQYD